MGFGSSVSERRRNVPVLSLPSLLGVCHWITHRWEQSTDESRQASTLHRTAPEATETPDNETDKDQNRGKGEQGTEETIYWINNKRLCNMSIL